MKDSRTDQVAASEDTRIVPPYPTATQIGLNQVIPYSQLDVSDCQICHPTASFETSINPFAAAAA